MILQVKKSLTGGMVGLGRLERVSMVVCRFPKSLRERMKVVR